MYFFFQPILLLTFNLPNIKPLYSIHLKSHNKDIFLKHKFALYEKSIVIRITQ